MGASSFRAAAARSLVNTARRVSRARRHAPFLVVAPTGTGYIVACQRRRSTPDFGNGLRVRDTSWPPPRPALVSARLRRAGEGGGPEERAAAREPAQVRLRL